MLVGIDPGKATGIAVWFGEALHPWTGEYDEDGVYRFLDATCGLIESAQVEFFTISQRTVKTAVDYHALHLIGSIKYAAHRCGYSVSFTNPADVKGKFPDAALRKAGLWHKSDHVRDATRHLLVPLIAQGLFDPKRLLL